MAENEREEGSLERLSEQLYSPEGTPAPRRATRFQQEKTEVPTDWPGPSDKTTGGAGGGKHTVARIFFIGAVLFFIGAIGIAAYVFTRGENIISSRNIDISVSGPVIVDAGEELKIDVRITNANTASIETGTLIVEFAAGSRSPEDVREEQLRLRESLGTIGSGDSVEKEISTIVFGEEGEEQEIVIALEYRVSGSNAVFVKEKAFTYTIGRTPLTFVVDAPRDINAGQEFAIRLEVTSNAEELLENILLVADYPFGFEVSSASPEPDVESRVWRLGDLSPGERKVVTLRGRIEAQDAEERTFRFTAGLADDNRRRVATAFFEALHTFSVVRPFVGVTIAVDRSTDETVAIQSGVPVRVDISWQNNLPVSVEDVEISASLSGVALDRPSVTPERGFYRSADDTVVWDKSTDSALGDITPGQSGRVSFSFRTLNLSSRSDIETPEIGIAVVLSGRRGDGSGPVEIRLPNRTARVESTLGLSSSLFYFAGPFTNTGPVPPKADTETTYTVTWSVSNSSNDVADSEIRGTLPSYVRWVGNTTSGENVTFNPGTGEVVWRIGNVDAGVGINASSPRTLSFQVALLPSLSQVGSVPVVLRSTRVSGVDRFTGTTIGGSVGDLTTRFEGDPSYQHGHETVVQ